MKKKSKQSISLLQRKLWDECKRIVRARYARKDGSWECYTCLKRIVSVYDAHTAHFIPKSICGAYLKYDLRNLRVCCMSCNVWLGGNGSAYYKRMVLEEGQEYVDQLFKDKLVSVKAYDWYQKTLEEYKLIEK